MWSIVNLAKLDQSSLPPSQITTFLWITKWGLLGGVMNRAFNEFLGSFLDIFLGRGRVENGNFECVRIP